MRKLYLVRHQKAGILTDYAFTEPPSEAQMTPLVAIAERLHGKSGWVRVYELVLLEPGEIPQIALPDAAGGNGGNAGSAAAKLFVGSGTGQVG
jgi:hypothetical protein